jgi:hypothetical protein
MLVFGLLNGPGSICSPPRFLNLGGFSSSRQKEGVEETSGIVISFFTGLEDLLTFPLRDFCQGAGMEVV